MRKITLEELKNLAINSRELIWEQAKTLGREPKIYLHWTAGKYKQTFNDYHINITSEGAIYLDGNLYDTKSHTWHRNTGAIGIALCCCYGANTQSLGMFPPTKVQIETMAQCITALADGLWLTIDKKHVMTHGEAAANEDGIHPHPAYALWYDEIGDGDTRWDLEVLGIDSPAFDRSNVYDPKGHIPSNHRGGDVLRGKANWYRKQWKNK